MQPSASLFFTLGLYFCLGVNTQPHVRRDTVLFQNGKDAITLNAKFKTLSPLSPCGTDEIACINDHLAQCAQGHFMPTQCNPGLVCRASPKVGSPGTTIDCMTESENIMRIIATGVDYTPSEPEDPSQTSLSLDPAVISTGFQDDGQGNIAVPSRTSSNNWINFCKTVNKPLTNGKQIPGGSCNTAPAGVIPSVDNMPSAKFIFPPNFAALTKNASFTVEVAISHLDTGWFTNPQKTFMSSPQEVNARGDVIGHSHIVIERLTGFGQTTPTDPKSFVYFKALNDPAVKGVLSTVISGGLPAGYYRIAVFHTGANHQPIAVPVAQRGALDDIVYFSVI
ncbi:hypothetical protein BDM02DRAFT_3185166 [Thelephora ganbajun]|uniref:Uncharacterized protein n=1 Tax=Thelephora ganbajun TaxID=370292 RepID=A0ACB6ZLY3_THEGA|nr:hypothetical protein BDM02DRAFT_3185166 [Thelephora ganbajun]